MCTNIDDLHYRLATKDPTLIAQIISKLVVNIEDKQNASDGNVSEVKFLKERCIYGNSLVSDVAAKALIILVKKDILEISSLLLELITYFSLTAVRSSSSLIRLIGTLLFKDLSKKYALSKECCYNLDIPQHPFISILQKNYDCWTDILQEIEIRNMEANLGLQTAWINLHKPLYLYLICAPINKNPDLFKVKIWNFLLKKNITLAKHLITWLQFESYDSVKFTSYILFNQLELTKEIINPYNRSSLKGELNVQTLLLLQTSYLYRMILFNNNSCQIIQKLYLLIECAIADGYPYYELFNIMLLMISKTVLICSSAAVYKILEICKFIIHQCHGLQMIVLESLKCGVLHWILNNCYLTQDITILAEDICLLIKNYNTNHCSDTLSGLKMFYSEHWDLIHSNCDIFHAFKLLQIIESWNNFNSTKMFIQKMLKSPEHLVLQNINLLYAIFLCGNPSITCLCLKAMLKCGKTFKEINSYICTLLLYKLSSSNSCQLHLQIIKSFPLMVLTKENTLKALNIIDVLSKGTAMCYSLSLTIYLHLWKMDTKFFKQLESLLNKEIDATSQEYQIVKAYALKEICKKRPHLYGKELIGYISKILNDCTNSAGSLSSALAIESITILCKEGVIDILTAWKTLEPNFEIERRVLVLQSLCLLISEVPNLSYVNSNDQFIKDVVKKLWNLAVNHNHLKVQASALSALACFSLDQICEEFPQQFFDEDVLNSQNVGVINESCWIHFLINCYQLSIASDFIIKMMEKEISSFLKYAYNIKQGKKRSVVYELLPTNSILKSIVKHLMKEVSNWKLKKTEVGKECLRILSIEYSKPLPPMDWSFLQELILDNDVKLYCVTIACHQCVLSETARRLIENYIAASIENFILDDALIIFEKLEHLCNSIQPILIKPFFEKSLHSSIILFENNSNNGVLKKLLNRLAEVLQNPNIQESNKNAISETVIKTFLRILTNDELFSIFLDNIIIQLSKKDLNKIKRDLMSRTNEDNSLKKYIQITTCTAAKTGKLNYLYELLELEGIQKIDLHFVHQELCTLFNKQRHSDDQLRWIMDHLGQIQAAFQKYSICQIGFYCDILVLAIVIFSNYDIYIINDHIFDFDQYTELFPHATKFLFNMDKWNICIAETLEFLYNIISEQEKLSQKYKVMFVQTLKCLRHEEEFRKNLKWLKYLNC